MGSQNFAFNHMLQLQRILMKNAYKFGLLILLLFSLMSANNLSRSNLVFAKSNPLHAIPNYQDVTPTPNFEDQSVIGSTNGILIMGFIITGLAILPLFIRRKRT